MAQLMSDFGNGSAGRTQRPNWVTKKPAKRNPFLAQEKKPRPKTSSYEKKYVTPYKKSATPAQRKKRATSSGARYYGKGKYPGSNVKHSVSKPKATTKRKSSGGAWSTDGKRFFKNGYVDSRGNKVVNGKWVAGSKKSSGSVKASKPKAVSKPKASIAKTTVAKTKPSVAKEPAKPKLSLLAKDYEDQIYKNQIAELNDSSNAFSDDTKAKQDRLTRNFNMNQESVQLNRTNSLQNSAEDYAARGMMRSGAYLKNMNETNKLFDDQKARMSSNYNDDSAEYARAKADYLRGIGTQKNEAKRQLADRIAVENAKRTAAATS